MPIDAASARTRRAVLAAALGAGAATVATAVTRPIQVQAASGDPLVMGVANDAGSNPTLLASTSGLPALIVDGGLGGAIEGSASGGNTVHGTNGPGSGVRGEATSGVGVYGDATTGVGVRGDAGTKTGVYGASGVGGLVGAPAAPIGVGVFGVSLAGTDLSSRGVAGQSAAGIGVHGLSTSSAGVFGESTSSVGAAGISTTSSGVAGMSGDTTAPPDKTGAFGYAAQDAASVGVKGESPQGTGVVGTSTSGIGVEGRGSTGIAGRFSVSSLKAGIALHTTGRVRLDKASGIARVAKGARSVTVTPGTNVATTSAVVATLMGSAGGTTTVHRVAVNATTDKFVIYLTAKATVAVRVAWHIFG
jgi:hypothetical protein